MSIQIGRRIRDLRQARGMTQEELAGGELTKSVISQYEKGTAIPSILSLVRISERLGVPAAYFLEEVPDRSSVKASIQQQQRADFDKQRVREALTKGVDQLDSVVGMLRGTIQRLEQQ